MAIDRTVNNVMVSRVVNMLKIEIIPITDDFKISSIGLINLISRVHSMYGCTVLFSKIRKNIRNWESVHGDF